MINNLEKLADILHKQKVVNKDQLKLIRQSGEPQTERHKRKRPAPQKDKKSALDLIESLKIDLGNKKTLNEDIIMRAVAREYDMVFKKLDPLELDPEVVSGIIPKPFALKHRVVPLYRHGDKLTVAVVDPEDNEAMDQIRMVSGLDTQRIISTRTEINAIINQFFGFQSTLKKAEEDVSHTWDEIGNLEQLSNIKSEDEITSTDKHIQNAVDFILKYALTHRASDVHVEPKREETIIRMRIDGVLMDTQKIPKVVHAAVVSRIKLLSRLDISEKRRPQDGRIKISSNGKEVEMRVSILPVAFGEKAVIRVFDAEMAMKNLDELGFYPEELQRFKRFLDKPYGIILVTGPTGSGKTTSLYSSLRHVTSPQKNVVTIEDPIEMVVPEFNQVGVQPSIDLTFASALRSTLRQDPDIIMIGEIRDRETAENAIQAALTGHLVLSTLHTNDTASSLTRLYDLGIEPYLIKTSLVGITAQRLIRVICSDCVEDAFLSPDKLAAVGLSKSHKTVFKKGKGCEKCRYTGYFGRTGVHEVMEITDELREMIDGSITDEKVKLKARKGGMKTLQENAARKLKDGVTTVEEALLIASG